MMFTRKNNNLSIRDLLQLVQYIALDKALMAGASKRKLSHFIERQYELCAYSICLLSHLTLTALKQFCNLDILVY